MQRERAREIAVRHRERGAREATAGTRHVKERRHETDLHRRREQDERKRCRSRDESGAHERARRGPLQRQVQEDAPVGSQTSFMSFERKYGKSRK
jgi:hypothetical protein